ncbi:MAG: imidazolonepropionase [candidate division Zixibacteria bacterium RBG_16_53_22]|nr:MAG: imidazolonepropionase [candidate division Zixibacteria bacterium RBG_16_53_22]
MPIAAASLIIKNASQLVTLHDHKKLGPKHGAEMADLNIIKNGAVAISGRRIVAVGESNKILKQVKTTRKVRVIDAGKRVVTPGLVDPHTHPVFAGQRAAEFEQRIAGKTYMEIAAAGGGIISTVAAVRKATKNALKDNGRKILDRMLTYGTTTIEAKSGYGLTTSGELKQLQAIKELNEEHEIDLVPTFLGAHEIPPEYKGSPDDYVALVCSEMIPKIADRNLAVFCDVFCEKGVFTPKQTRIILQTAQAYGLKIKLHADELSNTGGAELAAEFGAVSADHLVFVGEEGIHLMHKAGVIPVLLPGTTFFLGMERKAPARKMIEKGLAVAIGTDCNPGSSMTESMQIIMTLACLEYKMSPAEAISAATINAAFAIDKGNEVGSLAPGKFADLLIWDAEDYREIPYHFGGNMVESVYKKGIKVR